MEDGESDRVTSPGPKRRTILFAVLGVLGALVLIASGLSMHGCEEFCRRGCMSNLKQIGLLCHVYAEQHNGDFPSHWPDLRAVTPNDRWYRVFYCPVTGHAEGSPFNLDLWADYRLVPGLSMHLPPSTVLAVEPLGNHGGQGTSVLLVDGHVEWWGAAKVLGLDNQGLELTPEPEESAYQQQ